MAREDMRGLLKFVLFTNGLSATKSIQKQICLIDTMLFAPRDSKNVK